MEKFNNFFNISGNEYFDVDLSEDTESFIDPSKFNKVSTVLFDKNTASKKVTQYFQTVYELYETGSRQDAVAMINDVPEISATRLGYSRGTHKGKGPSFQILNRVFSLLVPLSKENPEVLNEPCMLPMFTPNFASDRFSDLITNIICSELCDFTSKICEKYGLLSDCKTYELKGYFDYESGTWAKINVKLPVDMNGQPIILIPIELSVPKYNFNVQEYISQIILPIFQQEHLERNSPLVTSKYVKKFDGMVATAPSKKTLWKEEVRSSHPQKGGSKEFALEESLKRPHLITQYILKIKK